MHNLESFIFDFLNATESAASAAFKLAGKGDNYAADQAAVAAMRGALNLINAEIKVVIGEGERDEAPMLYINEILGTKEKGAALLDLAVDPLEGTNLCASWQSGSLAVLAYGPRGSLLNAPDLYMEKFVTNISNNIITNNIIPSINTHSENRNNDKANNNNDFHSGNNKQQTNPSTNINIELAGGLEAHLEQNLAEIARAKQCSIEDLKVIVLKRERHKNLIAKIRKLGASIKLIEDGDIAAVLEIIINNEADIYLGIGGAPEGVLAAVAVKFLTGMMLAKLIFSSEAEKERAKNYGIINYNALYDEGSLISAEAVFIATGVTEGPLLKGVQILPNNKVKFESLIITKVGYAKISRVRELEL